MPETKAPVGWKKKTGEFNEKAEKAKKPKGEGDDRKVVKLKKRLKELGLRLKAKDIFEILEGGFAEDVTFPNKIEYRLYWIFLRTWIYRDFYFESDAWRDDSFDFIEDLMREYAASDGGKSFKKLVKKLVDEWEKLFKKAKRKLDKYDDDDDDEFHYLDRKAAYLRGVLLELKRILKKLG